MYRYRRANKIKKILILLLLVMIVSASSILVYSMYVNIDMDKYNSISGNEIIDIYEDETVKNKDISQILENVTKCVVGISKIKNTGSSILETDGTAELGLGTGIVISEDGYIVTNWHVAGNKYSSCYITLENGKTYNGNVLWADSDLDLAIVKINAVGLSYMNLGDSNNIYLGEKVYAIGNPIGIEFQRTVTSGIISGINRTIKIEDENGQSYMEDLIQTDASINAGNSGGPLINENGEVIGINSVKIESAEGIGFAIPINIIKPVIESYVTTGTFDEAYLGIFAYDTEVTEYLKSDVEFENGIYVVQISSDGPAYRSNLRVGDVITKVDSYSIDKMSELRQYIYTKRVGDSVVLTINRNGKERDISINLGRR